MGSFAALVSAFSRMVKLVYDVPWRRKPAACADLARPMGAPHPSGPRDDYVSVPCAQ